MGANTTRLNLPYPTGLDPNNVPANVQGLATALDGIAVSYLEDLSTNRPAPGQHGRVFFATDTSALYYDSGAIWTLLNLNPALLVQAKGDLLVGSQSAVLQRVAVGTDGQTLQANSGSPTGVQWANTVGQPLGLPGATAATRFVGGTSSGAPTSGTFATGDIVTDRTGIIWVCYAGGSPGSWRPSHQNAIGLTLQLFGASAANVRAVGGTTSGPPTSGTFFTGDFVVDITGAFWICIAGGSPGTWQAIQQQHSYICYQTVVQVHVTNVWTSIFFDTFDEDTAGGRDAYNPNRYVCRRSGSYRISGTVAYGAMTTGHTGCRIVLNSNPVQGTVQFCPYIPGGNYNAVCANPTVLRLNIGDILEIQGWHTQGFNLSTSVSQADVRCRFDVDQVH